MIIGNYALCHIEHRLRLLATRTTPVVGQVFEGNTVVLCWVIDVAADRADVLAGCFLLGEIDFGQNGRHRIIQIHHTLGLQILIALWGVGAAIDGGVIADELTDAVLRLAGSWQVIENYRQLVLVESLIDVGDVAVNHIEQSIHLYHDDAIALGVTLGLDVVDAVGPDANDGGRVPPASDIIKYHSDLRPAPFCRSHHLRPFFQ